MERQARLGTAKDRRKIGRMFVRRIGSWRFLLRQR
jgi:hypothetical protein